MARKPDELALFSALRACESLGPCEVQAAANRLGMHHKRLWSILEKWADAGWWDYGVTVRAGWFQPGAPLELKA